MKKIMLLGAGELGRELTISLKRLGCTVVACDCYENAPAMQVSDRSLVFDMLNEAQLRAHIQAVDPDLVVPEIEAINTQVLLDAEAERVIVPSARAVDLTMNRDRIRDRAAEIGLPTARYLPHARPTPSSYGTRPRAGVLTPLRNRTARVS